jgi:hypothetical protein
MSREQRGALDHVDERERHATRGQPFPHVAVRAVPTVEASQAALRTPPPRRNVPRQPGMIIAPGSPADNPEPS